MAAFAQGDPLRGLVDGGTVFVQSTLGRSAGDLGVDPGRGAGRDPRSRIRLAALDTAGARPAHAPRADLILRMQGVALVGVFLRLTPFAEQSGYSRDRLMRAVKPALRRFFGKRGNAVVEANLALIAEAFDGVIDVTTAVTALVPGPRAELIVREGVPA